MVEEIIPADLRVCIVNADDDTFVLDVQQEHGYEGGTSLGARTSTSTTNPEKSLKQLKPLSRHFRKTWSSVSNALPVQYPSRQHNTFKRRSTT